MARAGRRGAGARGTLVLVGALALGACAVGPDFRRPQASVSANWRPSQDPHLAAHAAADSRWWRAFNDPTLDRLVELAHRQNLPLQIAGLRIVEARARFGVATGQQFPQAQFAFGSAAAVGVSERAFTIPGLDRHYGDFRLGFDAAWEIDFWGKYRRGVQAEAAGLLASVADYDSALVSLTAEVARDYVLIRTFEVLIGLAEDNVRLQEESLTIAQSRFQNGATSELDPTQATTLLESTRASIPQLRVGLEQARNALGTLLGQQPGSVDSLLASGRVIPQVPTQVAVGVPAEMLRRRPDIRSAELYAAAQCARIGVAKADLYPSFTLFGTVGLESTAGLGKSANPFSSDALFYQVGPRINWSFLNYGRITNSVRVEDARFQQLLVGYQQAVLQAVQEVEDALSGFLHAQEATLFNQRAVTSAQRSAQLAVVQYREGATDFQRVLDAQRSLLQEQNGLAQSTSAGATGLVALYKALGGGWELRQEQPLVPAPMQEEMKQRTNWGGLLTEPRAPEQKTQATGSR